MKTLKVNSELQTLLPSLSDAEYKGLETDILEHGATSNNSKLRKSFITPLARMVENEYSLCGFCLIFRFFGRNERDDVEGEGSVEFFRD
jgi:hypothetical protein